MRNTNMQKWISSKEFILSILNECSMIVTIILNVMVYLHVHKLTAMNKITFMI